MTTKALDRRASVLDPKGSVLSPRELEVLTLCANGMVQKEIAKQLHISAFTVKHHFTNLFRKLGVNTAAHAVYLVFVKGQGREDK